MDIAPIISVLLKQAPYLMFSLLGLGMVLIGSTGKFIKSEIDPKDRPILKRTGWAIFWLFLIAALIEIIAPGSLKDLISLIPGLLSSPSTLLILLAIGSGILVVYYGVPYIQKARVEKNYRIDVEKVLDDPFTSRGDTLYRSAGLLVTSNADIQCVAKISKFTRLGEKEKIPVEIKDINPNGYYLRWDNGSGVGVIKEHRPRKIELADNYEGRDFFRHGRLLFENNYSKPIEVGRYLIGIDIYRLSGKKLVLMSSIEGVLSLLLYFKNSPSSIYGDGMHITWAEEKKKKRS